MSKTSSQKDKTYWIIGASSGIGAALAKELAAQGATVAISARSEDSLEALKAEMSGEMDGDGHMALPLDVTDHDALKDACVRIEERFPKLDSVVFMAAIYAPHDKEKKDIDFIQKMLHVNIGGAFNVIDIVQSLFEKQGFGQIALCASVAGYRGLPYGQPYCATKAALINLAESLKVEMAPRNIDVKVINPGFVKTQLTDKNTFKMPMIIEPEDAAKALAKGLIEKAFEIHFPKKFTYIMKFIRVLPTGLYLALAKHIKP